VYVTIGKGTKDITIRLRDRGGGVPYDALESIWDYSYTTVPHGRKRKASNKDSQEPSAGSGPIFGEEDGTIFDTQVELDMQTGVGGPMAGLGYGLPMSKVYANFFGGDLSLVSLYGHGCDVFLRLNRLGDEMEPKKI